MLIREKTALSFAIIASSIFLSCGGGDKRTLVTPVLSVQPDAVTLDLMVGSQDPASVKLQINNDADGLMVWNISGSQEWLRFENTLDPGNSSTTVSGTGPAEIVVQADPSPVSIQNPESISAVITVTATDPSGITASVSPLSIPVKLNIWDKLTEDDGLPDSAINNIYVYFDDTPIEIPPAHYDFWIGTNRGVALINYTGTTSYTYSNSGLLEDRVNTINVSPNKSVWFGTGIGWNDSTGGLSRLNPNHSWDTYTYQSTNYGLALNSVSAIASTSSGEMWFGTPGGGLSRLHGTTWTKFNTHNTPGLPGDFISALALGQNEDLWIGTDQGPVFFDGTNWSDYSDTVPGPVNAIAVDSLGATWVGTGNGCWILHEMQWKEFHPGVSGLPSDLVLSLAPEPGGKVWIGTASGLVKYENGTGESILFNHQPWNKQINSIGIEPDGQGGCRKWLATPEGVYIYPGD